MCSVAHGYFAYVNKISFAYPEHSVHKGVPISPDTHSVKFYELPVQDIFQFVGLGGNEFICMKMRFVTITHQITNMYETYSRLRCHATAVPK